MGASIMMICLLSTIKNKVSTMFALTANNVDDMSQFIKDIPIPA